ncbi:MAG: threonine--tRNA ligase, partial [Spirochaetae bacterium HGW-Spirochaetae-6]
MQEVVFQYRGKEYRVENVDTYADIAHKLTNGHHNFLVCQVGEKMVDLNAPITESSFQIDFFTFETPEGKDVYWHTAAHILAQAVKKLFPGAKYTIGPSIESGFYYDFDLGDKNLTPEDMEAIEKEARKITDANFPVVRKELSKDEALVLFQSNPYKVEIIKELPDEAVISIYEQGDFVDLCRGPHLISTGVVKELKVMSIAGAYWRGDSTKKMLQRVYAIAFDSSKALKKYLNFL